MLHIKMLIRQLIFLIVLIFCSFCFSFKNYGALLSIKLNFQKTFRPRSIAYVLSSSSNGTEVDNIRLFAANDKPDVRNNIPNKISSAPAEDIFLAKSNLELQAEFLRLEAEREQLLITQNRIIEEKKRLVNMDNFILKIMDAPNMELLLQNNKIFLRKELFFRLIELANTETDEIQKVKFLNLYDTILEKIQAFDNNLATDIQSEIKKDVSIEQQSFRNKVAGGLDSDMKSKEVNDTLRIYDKILQQFISSTKGGKDSLGRDGSSNFSYPFDNSTLTIIPEELSGAGIGQKVVRFPAALPLNLLPLMMRGPELMRADVEQLKTEVFTPDVLNNSLVDFSTFLATFRGNQMQGRSSEETIEVLQSRINAAPDGLADRVRLLVLPDYQTKNPQAMLEKYSGQKYDPVFTIISKEALPPGNSVFEYVGGAITYLATFITVFIYATDVSSLNKDFMTRALAGDVTVVSQLLPIVGGIFALQLAHDFGHLLAAKINGVKLSFPLPLPSIQIGLFGSVTRFMEYPKNRKQLFDIAISGPLLGFIASLGCVLYGLSATQTATPVELGSFPELPVGFFSSSFLLYELADKFLNIAKITDPQTLVPLHPLVAIGITGVLTNALNFIPIGRLDGGRVTMAIAGRQSANFVTFATLIGLGIGLISNPSSVQLFWSVLVVLFQRNADIPPEDDVTPVATDEEDGRKGLAWLGRLAALSLCTLSAAGALLPVPTQNMMQQSANNQAVTVEGGLIPGQGERSGEGKQSLIDRETLLNSPTLDRFSNSI